MENGVDQDFFFWSYIWIFSDSPGSDHRVVGKEAGFGISVKINSHRAYSGVNSKETLSLGAPLLSLSHDSECQ